MPHNKSVLKRWFAVPCVVGLLMVASCQRASAPFGDQSAGQSYAPTRAASAEPATDGRRYIAIRHKLEIETREADLQKAWESANTFCLSIKCEVVSASFTDRTRTSTPSGYLSVRVAPEDLSKFLGSLDKSGRAVHHTTENEDKTATVIDVDAKIKNLAGFRDGLRAMLAKPPASIKDLLEVQRELARVQAELDSESTRRKVLSDETDKVSVEISFRHDGAGRAPGAFEPIAVAWRESMNVLGASVAALISMTFALIPWIVFLWVIFWLVRKVWRKRKKAVA